MNFNQLRIEAYSSYTYISNVQAELDGASGLTFSTGYKGGLYLDASFFVARDVVRWWELNNVRRILIRNGLETVYEGVVDLAGNELQETSQGVKVTANGFWGSLLSRRRWQKIWCDNRIDEHVWKFNETAAGADKVTLERTDQIKFVPKAVAWLTTEGASVVYTMPTGETVKRITFDYDFQEAAQVWKASLYNYATSTEIWSVTSSGTGSADETLATPSQTISLRLISDTNQTPAADGTIYAKYTNIKVYSETGSINLTEIAKDIRAKITDLNSYEGLIGSNTLSLVPFYADSWDESVADILTRAASFGDASYNSWAVGIAHSNKATVPNGEPVLFVEQYPALTGYDYAIRVEEPNLVAPIAIERDYTNVWNWIIVEYSDINGARTYITPDDDANLKNTTSITDHGQRDYVLKVPSGDSTTATNLGRAFLAKYKDPQYTMSSPINVVGYIRTSTDTLLPASQIVAGKRIKIENYISDLSGIRLTFLITRTTYNDDSERCSIESGIPSTLDVILAQLAGSP